MSLACRSYQYLTVSAHSSARACHNMETIEEVQSSGYNTDLILCTRACNVVHVAYHRGCVRELLSPTISTRWAFRGPLCCMSVAIEIFAASRNVTSEDRAVEDLEAGLWLVPRNIMAGLEDA